MGEKSKQPLIAMVQRWNQLRAVDGFTSSPDIEIYISRLHEDGKPRNWSLDYEEPKNSTGGCFCRMWAHFNCDKQESVLFSNYGPCLSHGTEKDYKHGLNAARVVGKRLEDMYRIRGCVKDAGEECGRWLEATGIKSVYMRPEGVRDSGWLSEGEWQVKDIGQFLYDLRNKFPKPAEVAQVEESVAV